MMKKIMTVILAILLVGVVSYSALAIDPASYKDMDVRFSEANYIVGDENLINNLPDSYNLGILFDQNNHLVGKVEQADAVKSGGISILNDTTLPKQDSVSSGFIYYPDSVRAVKGSIDFYSDPSDDSSDDTSDDTSDDSTEELTPDQEEFNELEARYDDLKDDYDRYEDKYNEAVDDDDESDIDRYEDRLNDLDEELEDLDKDINDFIDDIEDRDDLTDDEENMIEDLEDLEDDVESLRDDIDELLNGDSSSDDFVYSYTPSSTSQDDQEEDSGIVIQHLSQDAVDSLLNADEQEATTDWQEVRYLAWMIAGIIILFALIVFFIALLMKS